MDPISTAIKIYEFIDQPLPMKLFQWIEDSTKVKVSQLGLGYGTVKNSIQTMFAWRHRMTFDEVCFVSTESLIDVINHLRWHSCRMSQNAKNSWRKLVIRGHQIQNH